MGSLSNRVDETIGEALEKVFHYLYPKCES